MEILAEILFELLAWLAEIGLQLLFELIARTGLRVFREPFRPRPVASPWIAAAGYVLFGIAAGALSLWPFPHSFLESKAARIANLAICPLAAGLVMSLLGARRRRRGEELLAMDRFAYGLLFALAMTIVRFVFARPL